MGGPHDNDGRTASPIKHVIVIMGENRTFDHVFATYQPRPGEHVDNLLSKGIVNKDGSPGPNYAKATQFSAVDSNVYSISPGQKTPYNNTTNRLQAPGTSYAPQTCYTTVEHGRPQWSGMHGHAGAGRPGRLRPAAAGSAVADDRRDRHRRAIRRTRAS